MANNNLTFPIIEREITLVCFHFHLIKHLKTELLKFVHNRQIGLYDGFITRFLIDAKSITLTYEKSDLFMSVDDFSERIIKPHLKPYLKPDHLFLLEECS